jgi:hypothetical protein
MHVNTFGSPAKKYLPAVCSAPEKKRIIEDEQALLAHHTRRQLRDAPAAV